MRATTRFVFAVFAALGISVAAARAADGRTVFTQHCAACHGPDGKAQTPMAKRLGVRDLSVLTLDEADLQKRIFAGVKNAKGVQVMPPFEGRLAADETAALVQHVKSLQKKS